jgi:hypothetical protein
MRPETGLLNPENCARFYLWEAETFDDAVDLQIEMGLELLDVSGILVSGKPHSSVPK